MTHRPLPPTLILSFVGLGDYTPTTYRIDDHPGVSTRYVHEALATWFPDARVVALATEAAVAKHAGDLRDAVGDLAVELVPTGLSRSEAWEIFDVITSCVSNGDRVLVDMTHGFRSQPALLLAACNFLEEAGTITVVDVVYGAFRADVPEQTDIVSLSPFLDLSRWAVAVDAATGLGAFTQVRNLVKGRGQFGGAARAIVRALDEFSDALETNRVERVFATANELSSQLGTLIDQLEVERRAGELSQQEIEDARPLAPLLPLLRNAQTSVARLGLAPGDHFERRINASCALIEQLFKQRSWQQAITVARETLVTIVCDAAGLDRESNARDVAEFYLNLLSRRAAGLSVAADQSTWRGQLVSKIDHVSKAEERIGNIWASVRNMRNDVNHGGYRQANKAAHNEKTIRRSLNSVIDALQDGSLAEVSVMRGELLRGATEAAARRR